MSPAFAVWLTGLPASGKSTITRALVEELAAHGVDVAVLESDALRPVLTPRPTYSEEERETFYEAMTYIGSLLVRHGVPVIFDATANRRAYRAAARAAIERFIEVYVDCPLDVCIARDPKGIYRKAQLGEASTVPGLQAFYEAPASADVILSGDHVSPETGVHAIVRALEDKGYLGRQPRAETP
ncbi:MAG: adenylyl-sulfate kinase [Vicinamibacterales bacterium]